MGILYSLYSTVRWAILNHNKHIPVYHIQEQDIIIYEFIVNKLNST